jgi:hypothetical protein
VRGDFKRAESPIHTWAPKVVVMAHSLHLGMCRAFSARSIARTFLGLRLIGAEIGADADLGRKTGISHLRGFLGGRVLADATHHSFKFGGCIFASAFSLSHNVDDTEHVLMRQRKRR